MQEKTDRRSRKTRAAIQGALIALATENDTTNVTVTDVCKRADINRSTFYTHFRDIPDVVASIEQDFIAGVFSVCHSYDFREVTRNPYPVLLHINEELERFPAAKEFLARSSKAPEFLEKLKSAFLDRLIDYYEQENGRPVSERLRFSLVFVISGLTHAYQAWLQSGSRLSLDDLCRLLSERLTEGFSFV